MSQISKNKFKKTFAEKKRNKGRKRRARRTAPDKGGGNATPKTAGTNAGEKIRGWCRFREKGSKTLDHS